MKLLEGKVAIITGAGGGIGRCHAIAFAKEGAKIVVNDLGGTRDGAGTGNAMADKVVVELKELGAEAVANYDSVSTTEGAENIIKTAVDAFGRVDILVNNAGMSPLYDSITSITEDLYDKVMDVNLKGVFRLSAVVGERMKADGRGSIVNVSSVAAVRPTPGEVVYAMAKAGMNNLTSSLARALGPEVRVNCLMPGPFLTDIANAWDLEAFARSARKNIPLGRGGEPTEIVGAALYLASDASSFTTGSVIKVDGGLA